MPYMKELCSLFYKWFSLVSMNTSRGYAFLRIKFSHFIVQKIVCRFDID